MLRKICFFNFWHNGDIFLNKAFVQHIMRLYPGFDYRYALGAAPGSLRAPEASGTNPDVIKDLRCDTITCDQLPDGLGQLDQCVVRGDWVLVNTWVGAYVFGHPRHNIFDPDEIHANYRSLIRMWRLIFEKLNETLGVKLQMSDSFWDAVPTTDWSVYNCAPAMEFAAAFDGPKMLLFSNGSVNSSQSAWGDDDMSAIIHSLARQHEDWRFICTRRFQTTMHNIFFTDNIFNQPCDINEIAFLSTLCDLIWGKVSGPYIYCHVRENLTDPNMIFMSCSDRPSDSPPFGYESLPCHYYHSLATEPDILIDQINDVVGRAEIQSTGRVEIL